MFFGRCGLTSQCRTLDWTQIVGTRRRLLDSTLTTHQLIGHKSAQQWNFDCTGEVALDTWMMMIDRSMIDWDVEFKLEIRGSTLGALFLMIIYNEWHFRSSSILFVFDYDLSKYFAYQVHYRGWSVYYCSAMGWDDWKNRFTVIDLPVSPPNSNLANCFPMIDYPTIESESFDSWVAPPPPQITGATSILK